MLLMALMLSAFVAPLQADDHAGSRPSDELEHLIPELAENAYTLEPGARKFLHRMSFSPAWGRLGSERLFAFRIAYNPNRWLGYEGTIAHNPGQAVHAMLHSVHGLLRYPVPGRFQPYGILGYGMVTVFPGQSINADPVTKNFLSFGGGLELYLRSDLAIRADLQHMTVFGGARDRDGIVAYDYLQQTIGLSFYRSIGQ
jgi:hypothetical protein